MFSESPSPGLLAGEAEAISGSVSCSGCSFVDQGSGPKLTMKSGRLLGVEATPAQLPTLQGRPLHWQAVLT